MVVNSKGIYCPKNISNLGIFENKSKPKMYYEIQGKNSMKSICKNCIHLLILKESNRFNSII